MPLLAKGAIEIIPSAQSESGFYSCYFLFPKKHSSLRPILDQRLLNRALMRRPFRMITLKDWFFSLDVKDAYFHIQIAPRNWPFLRFTFEGVAYQYTVLPFGLSLAPRTFMKWMDAALSPLRQMGIHILHYLDDWLVVAQVPPSQPIRVPGTQGQLCQLLPMDIVPGNSFQLWSWSVRTAWLWWPT